MAGTTIKEFLVGLGFEVDQSGQARFEAGIRGATLAVAALGAAVVAGGGLITKFVAGVADTYDALGDLAFATDTTADALKELQFVATLTDSSVIAVDSSIAGLSRSIGETVLGIGRAKKIFEELGVSVTDSSGKVKDTTAVLYEVGDAIKDLDKASQQAALGKLGIDPTLFKALTSDISGLRAEYAQLYKSLRLDVNAAAETSGAFSESMIRVKHIIDAATDAIALRLLPTVSRWIQSFHDLSINILPSLVDGLESVFGTINKAADIAFKFGGEIIEFGGGIVDAFKQANDASGGWIGRFGILGLAVESFGGFVIELIQTGLVRWAAGILGLILLYDDLSTFLQGGEALFGDFWGAHLDDILALKEALKVLWAAFLEGISKVGPEFASFLDTSGILASLSELKAAAIELFRTFADLFKSGDAAQSKTDWTAIRDLIVDTVKAILILTPAIAVGLVGAITMALNLFKKLSNAIDFLQTGATDPEKNPFRRFGIWIVQGVKSIMTAWQGLMDWFGQQDFESIVTLLSEALYPREAFEAFRRGVDDAFEYIKSKFGDFTDFAFPDFKDFAFPDFKDFAFPDFAVPDFKLPDFKLPDFKLPDFKDFAFPDFAFPDFKDFAFPDFRLPDFKLPDFGAWGDGVVAVFDNLAGSVERLKASIMAAMAEAWASAKNSVADFFNTALSFGERLIDLLGRLAAVIVDTVVGAFQQLAAAIGGISFPSLPDFSGAIGSAKAAVQGVFGGEEKSAEKGGGGFVGPTKPVLGPSPVAQNSVTNSAKTTVAQNFSPQTKITIDGSRSPEATAGAVAKAQKSVNADLARNMRVAVA
ncbi:MAG: hypothetical protein ACREVA_00200 [Burkholderiales bacterium]